MEEYRPLRSRGAVMRILGGIAERAAALAAAPALPVAAAPLNAALRRAEAIVGHDWLVLLISDLNAADEESAAILGRLARHNDVVGDRRLRPDRARPAGAALARRRHRRHAARRCWTRRAAGSAARAGGPCGAARARCAPAGCSCRRRCCRSARRSRRRRSSAACSAPGRRGGGAAVSTPAAPSREAMHGLIVPPAIAFWPATPSWYVLFAVLALLLLWAAGAPGERWRADAYRREALRALAEAQRPPGSPPS